LPRKAERFSQNAAARHRNRWHSSATLDGGIHAGMKGTMYG
jgi:hypothetical protein